MDLNLLTNGLLWIAVAVFVIARQFLPRAIRPATMIGLPAVVGLLGLRALAAAPPVSVAAVALLAVNLGLGAGMGIVRGVTVRIWEDPARGWMMQGTLLTFACWLVSIGLKAGLAVAGHEQFSATDVELLIAVTFGAQALVVWARIAGVLPVPAYDRAR
jgi:hypothetical protein